MEEEEPKFFVKNKRGFIHTLKKGDYVKEDGDINNIYRLEEPSLDLGGDYELLANRIVIEDGKPHSYGHYDLKVYAHCYFRNVVGHYLLPKHTLVSQEELVKFELTTNSIDFLFS